MNVMRPNEYLSSGIQGDTLKFVSYAIEQGKAAEHLVCADLLLSGYRAFMTEPGLPYDIVLDHDGSLHRIQVKSTFSPRNVNKSGEKVRDAYSWDVRRRGVKKRGQRLSGAGCDIVALVALDVRRVCYLPINLCGQTMQIMPEGSYSPAAYKGGSRWARDVSQFPISDALCSDLSIYKKSNRSLTHCRFGHELTSETTYTNPNSGNRSCRICSRNRLKRHME